MKKMKKFVALAAVASLAATTFAGCGKSEGNGSSNTGSDVWKLVVSDQLQVQKLFMATL